MVITMKEAPQLMLTCLSTIPGYLGHRNGTEYADYRDATIQGKGAKKWRYRQHTKG